MKKNNQLQNLGLSDDTIRVYESILQNGPLSVTEIGAHTKLYRPNIYECLEVLTTLNLVTVSPFGKRKKYTHLPPKNLKNVLQVQEALIAKEIVRLEDMISPNKKVPTVVVLQGKQALKMIYERMMQEIKKGDIYYRYQAIDTEKLSTGGYMSNTARVLRNAKDLERYVITNTKNKSAIRHHHNRYVKVLPGSDSLFDHGVGQIMYGSTTAIIDYKNETATVIESESITAFQKAIFKSLFHYL